MRGRRDFVDVPERQCGGKKRYPSKAVAKRWARRVPTAVPGVGVLRPYRCGWCDGWHLGHDRPKGWDETGAWPGVRRNGQAS